MNIAILIRWRLTVELDERESLIVTPLRYCETVTVSLTFPISPPSQIKNYTEFLITESYWDLRLSTEPQLSVRQTLN